MHVLSEVVPYGVKRCAATVMTTRSEEMCRYSDDNDEHGMEGSEWANIDSFGLRYDTQRYIAILSESRA